jgi:SagB-type dehydrogenase family enzyme
MNSIGDDFINKTKYQFLNLSDQMKGINPPSLQLQYPDNIEIISLPNWNDVDLSEKSVTSVINLRKSIRSYQQIAISLSELSYLLWCTQGVKEVISDYAIKRTVPSAGARHALETTLLVNRVDGLEPGLYRYLSLEHQLGLFKKDDQISNEIVKASFGQDFIKNSAVTFIWNAVIYRMKWRYGERAYRYIFLDAGHVAQNLYLSAESIGCGVCAIAAFSDDEMNQILNIDGKEQFVIYMAAVGKKKITEK